MAFDMLSWILLIAGIFIVVLALLKVFKNVQIAGIIGVVLVVFGVLGGVGAIDYSDITGKTSPQGFTGTSQPQQPPQLSVPSTDCRARGLTSDANGRIGILYKNFENSTGDGYLAATFSTNNELGQRVDGSTSNAGGSGTAYVTLSSTPLCTKGQLVATVTTGVGVASSRKVTDVATSIDSAEYSLIGDASKQYIIKGASLDVVSLLARDRGSGDSFSNGNDSGAAGAQYAVSGTGTADGVAFYRNTSLASKGTINFKLEVSVNGTSSVFGAYDEPDGVIISFDAQSATVFDGTSLSLQSDTPGWALTKLKNCPTDIVNNRNAEACWSAPTMKSGTTYYLVGTLTATGGDPGATATPRLYFDDKVIFRDVNGLLAYQFFSSTGGTNQGVGGSELRFVLN